MKKAWFIALAAAAALGCAACAPASADVQSPPPAAPTASATQPTPSPTATAGAMYTITEKQYTYAKEGKDFKVAYPELSGGNLANAAQVNALILSAALTDVNAALGQELESGQTLTIDNDYTVTFSNPGFISVLFTGYYSDSLGAHPSSTVGSVSIDLVTGKAVRQSDMINVSGALTDALYAAAEQQLPPDVYAELTSDDFGIGLIDNVFFITPEGVGFSVSVYHFLGDHLEVTLPFAQAKPFMTNNEAWDRITR